MQKRTAKRKVSRMLRRWRRDGRRRGGVEEGENDGGEDRAGGLDELDEEEAAEGDFERERGDGEGEEREECVAEVGEAEVELGVEGAESIMGRIAARMRAQPSAKPRKNSSPAVARAGRALVARMPLRRNEGVRGGVARGEPAKDGEADEQEEEEEGLLQEVREDGEVEADGEALGGALGETLGSDDPETCAEEEQEVEGSREGEVREGCGNGLIGSFGLGGLRV